MIKTHKNFSAFIFVLVQSTFATACGVAALAVVSQNTVPPFVYSDEMPLGGMSYEAAAEKLEMEYAGAGKLTSLKIDAGSGEIYEIPFSAIDAAVDGNATVKSIKEAEGIKNILNLFNAYFGRSKLMVGPAVRFNEGKLRREVAKLAQKVAVAPSDAEIRYKDGIIERKAETPGLSLNVENAVEVIRKQLSVDPRNIVRFDGSADFEFRKTEAGVKLKDFDDIQQVFSAYSTKIISGELSDSAAYAAAALNGVVLDAAGKGKDDFSFAERLKAGNDSFENDNEGYDQVASTLYAALLSAGVPSDSIVRTAHELPAEYIEPGLDAWISGNTGDLKFSNPFAHKIAIFAQIEDGNVIVAIAGNMSDSRGELELKTEITQKFSPQVYYVESNSMKKGEKVVLNPGREGIMVNVYVDGKLIGTDKYEAEKKIVQIGPGTGIKDSK